VPATAVRFDVLTLFPDLFPSYLSQALLDKAIQAGLVTVKLWNLRDWATGKHQKVDDRPYGGGPGMVMLPEPVVECVEAVQADSQPGHLIMLTPAGRRLNQRVVEELAEQPRIVLLCGRYEGFDDRIRQILKPDELSIGDFVCNGGEVPAMCVIDSVIRLIPGVLGDDQSAADDSHNQTGRLEFPQYTRPRIFRGLSVPEILLSGDHGKVAEWRNEQSRQASERSETRTDTPNTNPPAD
jgi:tRNA (guanine37-N1)-methyltransferase